MANKASAMPGATTARLVFLLTAIAWKLVMMPHTVPNRPMKGAVEPTVARNVSLRSSRSTSREMVTSMTFSTLSWTPGMGRVPRSPPSRSVDRFHSRIAATNSAAMPVFRRCAERL